MKVPTLRKVTLVLLLALLASAVDVTSGSGQPTPAQKDQQRRAGNQNNNVGQGTPDRNVPKGGVQVLPPLPTDGARPVPPAGPTAGTTNGPAAQPHQQGNVRQLGEQLGLNQIIKAGPQPQAAPAAGTTHGPAAQPHQQGNVQQQQREGGAPRGVPAGNGVPPVVSPRNPGGPVVLGDVNEAGEGGAPRGVPAGNEAPPVVNPRNPGGAVVLGDAGFPPQGQLQPRNAAPVIPPSNPVGEPAAANNRLPRMLGDANAPSHLFNPYAQATVRYSGRVLVDNNGQAYLDDDGTLNGERVGKFRAGGATARVHDSSDPNFVKKIISLNWNHRPEVTGATITDQRYGRMLLQEIEKLTTLFRVAQQKDEEVVQATDDAGNPLFFVLSREENIESTVYRTENTNDPSYSQLVYLSPNTPKKVSNAEERAKERAKFRPGANRTEDPLTELEELTIQLVIRDLNDRGIVWTDQKLANLDIVRQSRSPTGYQVIFFDFDGFRKVQGDDPKKMATAARAIQRAFDAPAQPVAGADREGWDLMSARVINAYKQHYQGEPLKSQDSDLGIVFDLTPFNNQPITTIASPYHNLERAKYLFFNSLDEKDFLNEVLKINTKYTRRIPYSPINLKSTDLPNPRVPS